VPSATDAATMDALKKDESVRCRIMITKPPGDGGGVGLRRQDTRRGI